MGKAINVPIDNIGLKSFARKPTCNLQEAAAIYLGFDPVADVKSYNKDGVKNLKSGGFALLCKQYIAEYDDNGKFLEPTKEAIAEYVKRKTGQGARLADSTYSLEGFVRASTKISPRSDGGFGKLEFIPKEIIEFFVTHFVWPTPNPQLLKLLTIKPETLNIPPPKQKLKKGRKEGHGQYDDTKYLKKMKKLITKREAKSPNAAAIIIAQKHWKPHLAQSIDAMSDRLGRKYRRQGK
jgi:hypothetical protein